MQSLGHGYAGTEKFNTLINIPKPMTVSNYNKTVSKIIDVVNFVVLFIKGIEIKKFECVGHYQKLVRTRLWNLKKKEKGLGQRWEGLPYRCHNWSTAKFCRCSYSSNCWGPEKYEIKYFSFLFSCCFNSNKDNMCQCRYSPIRSDSWCRYNADRATNTQTCKPGPDLPKDIIYKIRPKFGIRKRHWIWKVFAW